MKRKTFLFKAPNNVRNFTKITLISLYYLIIYFFYYLFLGCNFFYFIYFSLTLVNLHQKTVSTECDFSQTVFETELLENSAFYIVEEMIQKNDFRLYMCVKKKRRTKGTKKHV